MSNKDNPYLTDIELGEYGKATDLLALPVGASFFVVNGDWTGSIILDNKGNKAVRVVIDMHNYKVVKITEKNRYSLVLDYLSIPQENE